LIIAITALFKISNTSPFQACFPFDLNPASPKNQLINPNFYSRVFVTYDLPLRGMSMDIGFFYRYTPGIAKISGNLVAISQAQSSFPHKG
jgi:hypothetical protein